MKKIKLNLGREAWEELQLLRKQLRVLHYDHTDTYEEWKKTNAPL